LFGASIAVIAVSLVGDVGTPVTAVTAIVRAEVAIVTGEGNPADTLAAFTDVADGAQVTVITGEAIVLRRKGTLTGEGVASCGQADGIGAFGLGATYFSPRFEFALMRDLGGVANQGSITDIPIFKRGAVVVARALAVDGNPNAEVLFTAVRNGARIFVVAINRIWREDAASRRITGIVGADVVVVAGYRRTAALPGRTEVRHSAGITIDALDCVEGLVVATFFSEADVVGTSVVVITGIFIGVPIAIVIEAIADVFRRNGRITISETLIGAVALPRTRTKFVVLLTGSCQSQRDGLRGARTNAGISHALHRADAIDCDCRQTRKTPGAVIVGGANSTAIGPLFFIIDADVIGTTGALAICTGRARLAEIGDQRDANEGKVGTGTDGLAAPTGRAFFLADLGTNSVAHMLKTPARLTIAVGIAGVKEAALPRFALNKRCVWSSIE